MIRNLAAIAVMATAPAAMANLVQDPSETISGSGLGAVSTILTSSGTGCVGWDGTQDVIGGSTCAGWSGITSDTNLHQTRTWSLDELGISSISEFRVIFNPSETGSSPDVTLNALVVMVFAENGGSPIFTSSLASPVYFPDAGSGVGSSGYVFKLDAADQIAAASIFSDSTNRVGLAFSTSGHDGADETFFYKATSVPPAAIPEPATWSLIGSGLLLAGLGRRRRR